MQDLYSADYKMLLKEIEDDLNKWKNLPCSWMIRLNIVKMAVFPKLIYTFNAIPVRIPIYFFLEIDEMLLKFILNCKDPRTAKTILKKNKVERLILPHFKTHYTKQP